MGLSNSTFICSSSPPLFSFFFSFLTSPLAPDLSFSFNKIAATPGGPAS